MRRWQAAALVCAMVLAGYWKLVFSGQYTWLWGDDTALQVLPWLQMQASEWGAGRVPLWDPYQWMGQSLVGQAQPGVANPLNWVLASLPRHGGWLAQWALHAYFVAIHLLGAWFAYLLAREMGCGRGPAAVGGGLFAVTGWFGSTEWPQMISGAMWAPLVFLYLLRTARRGGDARTSALGGFFLGLSFLSGHHQIPMFVAVAAVFVWVWWLLSRRAGWRAFVVFWALAGAASAVQVLPAQEYGRLALRWVGAPEPLGWSEKVPYAVHERFGLKPASLVGVLIPGQSSHPEPYVGMTALALALAGAAACWRRREARLAAALAVGGLLYALAQNGFIEGVLYALVPNLDKARSSSAAVFLTGLGVAMLVACGLEWGEARWLRRMSWTAFGLVAAVAFARLVAPKGAGAGERAVEAAWCAAALGVVLHLRARGWLKAGAAGAALVALLMLEASLVTMVFTARVGEGARTATLESLSKYGDIAEYLRTRPGLARVDVDDAVVRYNFGDWHGIRQTGGYLASVSTNVFRQELHAWWAKRLLGVAYSVAPAPGEFHHREVFTGRSGVKVFAADDVMPPAFAVHDVYRVDDRKTIAAQLYLLRDELDRKAFVTGPAPRLDRCGTPDHVEVLSYAPNRVRLRASLGCRGMVVLTDAYYPGWKAQVDGRGTAIHEAYGFVRGVVVEGGEHAVEFVYRPASVMMGALLSLGSALAALGCALHLRLH